MLAVSGKSIEGALSQKRDKGHYKEEKYLIFGLESEEYGLKIHNVKEIIGFINITSIPLTPKYYKGVINLRGKVIPVIDLRLKVGMDAIEYNGATCIIVVDIAEGFGEEAAAGIVVDYVSDVRNIKSEEIEDTSKFGLNLQENYISGISKVKGRVTILLNINKILTTDTAITESMVH